jgi:hypothetical protein
MTQLSQFAPVAPVAPQFAPYPAWGSPEMLALRSLPVERLEFQRPDKNWHGSPIAEIRLVQSQNGWHWSTGYNLEHEGQGGPVDFGRIAASREDALALATVELTERLSRKADTSAMARAAIKWMGSLI